VCAGMQCGEIGGQSEAESIAKGEWANVIGGTGTECAQTQWQPPASPSMQPVPSKPTSTASGTAATSDGPDELGAVATPSSAMQIELANSLKRIVTKHTNHSPR